MAGIEELEDLLILTDAQIAALDQIRAIRLDLIWFDWNKLNWVLDQIRLGGLEIELD